MGKANNKGFTLVELIIVITIIAILATIAFISFQGYTAESRDTKRVSDIGNMIKQVQLKTSQGVNLLSFVSNTGSEGPNVQIAGTGAISGIDYKAGDVNLTALGAPDNYTPNDGAGSYQIGVTTKLGGKYQFATVMEKNSVAYVNGTYEPRNATGSGVGFFYLGDYVKDSSNTSGTITKISSDMMNITFVTDTSSVVVTPTDITLIEGESDSLIYNGSGSVINGGSVKPVNQGGL